MNKLKFLNILNHPESITENDLVKLEALAKQYPYSQLIHILVAKGRHNLGLETFKSGLHKAALSATNRDLLKKLIEDVKISNVTPPISTQSESVGDPEMPVKKAEAKDPIELNKEFEAPAAKTDSPAAGGADGESVQEESRVGDRSAPESIDSDTAHDITETTDGNSVIASNEAKEISEGLEPADETKNVEGEDTDEGTGIHSELMANLEKLRKQRESLKNENRDHEIQNDTSDITDHETSQNTDGNDEANAIDTPTESDDIIFDPPTVELTDALISDIDDTIEAQTNIQGAKSSESESMESDIPIEAGDLINDLTSVGETQEELGKVPNDDDQEQQSQIQLIDSFIKSSPVLSRPNLSADSEATSQADLSVKSGKFHKDFVSENLAYILAKQGNRKDAVGIYKKLMVKFPEKKAYFADQIENLKTK